ncbi:hypothetical protein ABW20_dc0109174 [Dactylellina cionopaga]|nr:hypothetical protein ABW20_dc0109174 [Dactylellina cionopaga]
MIIHRHPKKNWNDPKCHCEKLHDVLNRHLPCPFCLKQILLRTQLQQKIQEEAAPGEYVELDYTKRPVFYGSDEPSPNPEDTGGKIVATKDRKRRNTCYPGVELTDNTTQYKNIGQIDTEELNKLKEDRVISGGSISGVKGPGDENASAVANN